LLIAFVSGQPRHISFHAIEAMEGQVFRLGTLGLLSLLATTASFAQTPVERGN